MGASDALLGYQLASIVGSAPSRLITPVGRLGAPLLSAATRRTEPTLALKPEKVVFIALEAHHLSVLDELNALGRHAGRHRCFPLMVGLLAMLAIGPVLESLEARFILYALEIGAFASAVHAVGGGSRHAAVVVLLGAIGIALAVFAPVTKSLGWAEVTLALFIVFGIFTMVRLFVYVLRPGVVTVDKIYAGLSVYLLAGFTWAGLYALTDRIHPGSFHWSQTPEHRTLLLQGFVYVSFVTLASLGYGDVTPLTPEARSLAILEAVFGTFYLVVIIARLVAGYETSGRR